MSQENPVDNTVPSSAKNEDLISQADDVKKQGEDVKKATEELAEDLKKTSRRR